MDKNDELQLKINEIRNELISQYGNENKSTIVNGKTYNQVNSNLFVFDVFVKYLTKCYSNFKINLDEYRTATMLLLEFAKTADPSSVDRIARLLKSVCPRNKKLFFNLLNDLNNISPQDLDITQMYSFILNSFYYIRKDCVKARSVRIWPN